MGTSLDMHTAKWTYMKDFQSIDGIMYSQPIPVFGPLDILDQEIVAEQNPCNNTRLMVALPIDPEILLISSPAFFIFTTKTPLMMDIDRYIAENRRNGSQFYVQGKLACLPFDGAGKGHLDNGRIYTAKEWFLEKVENLLIHQYTNGRNPEPKIHLPFS